MCWKVLLVVLIIRALTEYLLQNATLCLNFLKSKPWFEASDQTVSDVALNELCTRPALADRFRSHLVVVCS